MILLALGFTLNRDLLSLETLGGRATVETAALVVVKLRPSFAPITV
jgi:hypothetical protein